MTIATVRLLAADPETYDRVAVIADGVTVDVAVPNAPVVAASKRALASPRCARAAGAADARQLTGWRRSIPSRPMTIATIRLLAADPETDDRVAVIADGVTVDFAVPNAPVVANSPKVYVADVEKTEGVHNTFADDLGVATFTAGNIPADLEEVVIPYRYTLLAHHSRAFPAPATGAMLIVLRHATDGSSPARDPLGGRSYLVAVPHATDRSSPTVQDRPRDDFGRRSPRRGAPAQAPEQLGAEIGRRSHAGGAACRLARPLPIEHGYEPDREALRVVLGLPRAVPAARPGGRR